MTEVDTKERGAELLRLTLGHMGRHDATYNPLTFTVWYEFVAGTNPALNAALSHLLSQSARIDDEAVARLYKAHVAPADADSMERISGELQRLMSGMATSASHAGHRVGAYGNQLSGLKAALVSRDVEQLSPQLIEVLAGTDEMKLSVDALQSKVASSQEEIGRLRADLERARGEALLDPLTGILNRKGFDQKLKALLALPMAPDRGHCLVLLDIDHFKQVNDQHGHVMGDRVIQAVGGILRGSLTHPNHAVARYGGEEFAMILPNTTLAQGAELAEAVRMRTKAMRIRKRQSNEVLLSVTISGGLAPMKPGDDAFALIARADSALYQSKHQGRDRVTGAVA